MDETEIFPTDELLDHMPALVDGIGAYLEDPSDEISAQAPVIRKAIELGELRFTQGVDAARILKEYEILGGILFSFCARVVRDEALPSDAADLVTCSYRLFRAISVIQEVTTSHYLRALGERVGEREERLRRFNRMITHELKNRVGATLGAGQLLQEEWLGDDERRRFAAMVTDNALAIQKVMENLTALSRLDSERRRQRDVLLRDAVAEVKRQTRDLARARLVTVRVAGELPDVAVNAAVVELCLSNYLSNAIKYSDRSSAERWVEIGAALEAGPAGEELVVRVRDNGPGVPVEHRARLFERFFRGAAESGAVEGTGLGLSLVQETVESLGGRAWAEFAEEGGSVFAFSLPSFTPATALSDRAGVAQAAERPQPDAAPVTKSD